MTMINVLSTRNDAFFSSGCSKLKVATHSFIIFVGKLLKHPSHIIICGNQVSFDYNYRPPVKRGHPQIAQKFPQLLLYIFKEYQAEFNFSSASICHDSFLYSSGNSILNNSMINSKSWGSFMSWLRSSQPNPPSICIAIMPHI